MLSWVDWAIVGGYALLTLAVGVWVQRRGAGDTTENYFLSGRNLPWWLAGTSMAASAFSIDTPLYVAKITQLHGVQGNFEWWFMGVSGILGATVMARYWRRAGITTDLELITLRYSGRAAAALRVVRAVFLALLINCLGMAAVIAAAFNVLSFVVPGMIEDGQPTAYGVWILGGFLLVTVTYSVLSGFMGVVLTDLLQFVISIVGAVWLAVACVQEVGGLAALTSHPEVAPKLVFLPDLGSEAWGWEGSATRCAVFMGVQWWAFVNADGGGKSIQRLAGCRSEDDAERATWFSAITFIALRSWPWILVGLAALILFPGVEKPENNYPRALMTVLGPGARGVVLASLIAAFMSTIDTQLNWGASYLVNDVVRPYLLREGTERQYVWIGRLCAVPLIGCAGAILWLQARESEALAVTDLLRSVLMVSSGLGAVYLLRWFWWRLTAWAEIAAMIAAPIAASAARQAEYGFSRTVLSVTAITLVVTVVAAIVGPREDRAHLRAFAERCRPAGWWSDLRPADSAASRAGAWILARFVAGNAILFGLTFALGGLVLQREAWVVALNVGALCAGLALDAVARGKLSAAPPAGPPAAPPPPRPDAGPESTAPSEPPATPAP